jgi:ketosteroid isomerase-like protein
MSPDTQTYAESFLEPWNDQDIARALTFMSDDAVWEFTVGSDPWGTKLEGTDAIRTHMEELYASVPDLHYDLVRAYAGSGFLVMEVRVTGTRAGQRLDYQACDILAFEGELVAAKRSYRKVVS